MKNKFIKTIAAVFSAALVFTSTTVLAADFQFDANYYARRYPDVVAVLGNDPAVLQNHYNTSGIAEGRFCSQAEESYYFESGITKPKQEVKVVEQAKVENDTTVSEQPIEAYVYEPVEISPIFKTYVDVDIDQQLVTYVEDWEQIMQSPCVTGNVKTKHSTPTGTFSIKTHQTNKYLIGPTWKSYVSYWMRFTDDACGLHDASWRNSFGGDIYKTNGSHGCVNLPKDFAADLYDKVSVGTTVYVH